jgi:hypothetical protein
MTAAPEIGPKAVCKAVAKIDTKSEKMAIR